MLPNTKYLEIQISNFQNTFKFWTFIEFLFELLILPFGPLRTQLCFAKLCHHPQLQLDAVRIMMKFWKIESFDKYFIKPLEIIL